MYYICEKYFFKNECDGIVDGLKSCISGLHKVLSPGESGSERAVVGDLLFFNFCRSHHKRLRETFLYVDGVVVTTVLTLSTAWKTAFHWTLNMSKMTSAQVDLKTISQQK